MPYNIMHCAVISGTPHEVLQTRLYMDFRLSHMPLTLTTPSAINQLHAVVSMNRPVMQHTKTLDGLYPY